ncbi:hypothetical protein PCA31118_03988 [Pandoraea captiosa]|uniref:Ethyl tert-butyl ether degradation protein EthD n=1 Tax=Pandoraea captiosa TaxID=2508302 RepID=A0A5E5AF53_9BURK|nr:EthD family reductase [Pandoraea captiosa]VVE71838.1 hypothetical protein PCA31118_03988 [Pandoraea captiosa]
MALCVFLTATAEPAEPTASQTDEPVSAVAIRDALHRTSGLQKLAVHLPDTASADDPFIAAERAPKCAMQLYFGDIETLEAALTKGSALHSLLDPRSCPSFRDCDWTLQAMLTRRFSVPEPCSRHSPPSPPSPGAATRADGEEKCTYLVAYEGPADDENAWHDHYIRHHPPLMAQLPGVREIEIYTRIDYRSSLPAERVSHMQRNKTVFDSLRDLTQALASPIRQQLREDFLSLPAFSGGSPHYPMRTFEYRIA